MDGMDLVKEEQRDSLDWWEKSWTGMTMTASQKHELYSKQEEKMES